MNSSALIIMAKEPKVGSTKTRLCPPLTLTEAAQLYDGMLRDTIAKVSMIENIDLAIAITPPESTDYFKKISSPETILIPVEGVDIGECLSQVLGQLLDLGYEKVFALNADGPTLPPSYIQKALLKLNHHDIVLGPADDGGYYLIGLKELHSEIFTGIEWSTDYVLTHTLKKTKQIGWSVYLLPSWYDVDIGEDLYRMQDELITLSPQTLVYTRKFLDQWARTR